MVPGSWGPHNVLIHRADGTKGVRPFRGLRKISVQSTEKAKLINMDIKLVLGPSGSVISSLHQAIGAIKKMCVVIGFGFFATPLALSQPHYSAQGMKAFWDKQDWEGMLQYAQAWTRAEPRNAMAWYELGSSLALYNDPNGARSALLNAVNLQPIFPQAWNGLGLFYMQTGQTTKAVNAFQHAVRQAPDNDRYRRNLTAASQTISHKHAGKEIQSPPKLHGEQTATLVVE